jgi:hypothetical protein
LTLVATSGVRAGWLEDVMLVMDISSEKYRPAGARNTSGPNCLMASKQKAALEPLIQERPRDSD